MSRLPARQALRLKHVAHAGIARHHGVAADLARDPHGGRTARCGRGGILARWAGERADTGILLPGGRPCAGVPEERNGQPTHDQRGDGQNGHHDRPAVPK